MTTPLQPKVRVLFTGSSRVGAAPLPEEEVDVLELGDRSAMLRMLREGELDVTLVDTPANDEDLLALLRRLRLEGRRAPLLVCGSSTPEAEFEGRQARKMETLGRLTAGIVHDFNNLLTVMLSCNEHLLLDTPVDDPRRGLLREMGKAADRAAALTRKLLAFSRKQTSEPEVLDLNHVIKDMEPTLRRLLPASIRLEIHQHRGLSRVWADPVQMEQVLLNLVLNSRDAMPSGGRLIVATEEVPAPPAALPHGAPTRVLLRVSDTGCGMDAATRERLFEPFFTTKSAGRGSGLGLSTVQQAVRQSGGSIEVASVQGQGTSFSVFLPTHAGPAGQPASLAAPALPASGEETILLVEDDPSIRGLWRQTLQDLGYHVLAAPDGQQALTLALGVTQPIQIVVIDADLPGRSGWEAVGELRQHRPNVSCLLVTGHGDDGFTGLMEIPAEATLLRKPFPPSTLARKIRELLDAVKT